MTEGTRRNKQDLHATVSSYVKEKVDRLVKEKKFPNNSNLTETALIEFLYRYELKQQEMSLLDLIIQLRENEVCKTEIDRILHELKNGSVMKRPKPGIKMVPDGYENV